MIEALVLQLALAAGTPPDPSSFESWFVDRDVMVQIARSPGPIPWIRGTGDLDASSSSVESVLVDFAGYRPLMSPAVLKADVLETGEQTARLHMVWHYPFPLRNRDAIVRYRSERASDGTFHLKWYDDARPGDPAEGVRIGRVAGETVVSSLGTDRCRVIYTYYADLGGSFPRSAEEKAWRAEPVGYFRALRRRLRLPDPP
jgi:hypothetical protein